MRIYETTFIVNPQMDEATIDRQVKAVADIITNNGGKIIQENHLGTRRLAYEIKGLTQGFYGGFIFESTNTTLAPLDRHYKLNEDYLRHLTVRFEGDPASLRDEPSAAPAEEAAPKSEPAKTEAPAEETPAEPAAEDAPAEKAEAEAEPEKTPEAPAEEPKQAEPAEAPADDTEEML